MYGWKHSKYFKWLLGAAITVNVVQCVYLTVNILGCPWEKMLHNVIMSQFRSQMQTSETHYILMWEYDETKWEKWKDMSKTNSLKKVATKPTWATWKIWEHFLFFLNRQSNTDFAFTKCVPSSLCIFPFPLSPSTRQRFKSEVSTLALGEGGRFLHVRAGVQCKNLPCG